MTQDENWPEVTAEERRRQEQIGGQLQEQAYARRDTREVLDQHWSRRVTFLDSVWNARP